ncbi:MAG: FkbM family methyltransferase [Verrucomicrobiales bacterium]|nr:FkbM family methyltransferase [Verrucomicrobiales bacterium]
MVAEWQFGLKWSVLMKKILKNIPGIGPALKWLKKKIDPPVRRDAGYWLGEFFPNPLEQVVQIGSNDGVSNDPLHQLLDSCPASRALFVEPVPYLFARLQENYKDWSQYAFENSAINDGSKAIFYWIGVEAVGNVIDLPEWYSEINSFDKEHIVTLLPRCEPYIQEVEIEGITLADLFGKHEISGIDILHIDTEGYDFKILSQLDLRKYLPRAILYEHKHLGEEDLKASLDFLRNTYVIFQFGGDTLAVLRSETQHWESVLSRITCFRVGAG